MPYSTSSTTSSSSSDLETHDLDLVHNHDIPLYSQQSSDVVDISFLSETSPEYTPVSAPPYSAKLAPDETFLGGTPALSTRSDIAPLPLLSYKYRSPGMILEIISRQARETTSPAFGWNGLIQGNLQVDGGLRPGDTVQLMVQGIATSSSAGGGRALSRHVLLHSQCLHPATENRGGSSRNKKSTTFPISFQLPDTIEESNIPLPPTFYFRRLSAAASVQYSLRVTLTRKGLIRRNEEIETAFLYLPRSMPSRPVPQSWWTSPSTPSSPDAKIFSSTEQASHRWKTIPLSPPPIAADLHLQLCLPTSLSCQAENRIRFKVVASSSTADALDCVLDNAHIDLVKITTVTTEHQADVYEETLATGSLGKRDGWEPSDRETDGEMTVRTAHGSVSGGLRHGETTWSVPDMMQVEYAIRVGISSSVDLNSVDLNRQQYQPVEFTTHSSGDFEDEAARVDAPVLELVR
ncbi:hypothetical protein FRB98_003245 [Tulasnella sp. 332]|nr:hypothetical protein FRB98_003245 [Tulasnella sp. 332]